MRLAPALALAICVAAAAPAVPAAHGPDDARAFEAAAARDPRQTIAEAQGALSRARAAGDKRGELRALRLLAMSYEQLEENPGLRESSARGLALARELGDATAQAELLRAQATSAHMEGRGADALSLNDQAIELARGHDLPRELAKSYLAKAYALAYQDRSSEAMELLLAAFAVFERLGDRLQMAATLSEVGNLLTSPEAGPDELRRAIHNHRRALELMDARDHKYEVATVYHNLGLTHYYLGEHDEARRLFEACAQLARELRDPQTLAFVSYRVGIIDLAQGNPRRAAERFQEALAPFREAENLALEFMSQLGRARALAALQQRREAMAALAEARELSKRLTVSPRREAQYHEAAAEVLAALGQWERAHEAMGALRLAERRLASATHRGAAAELQARFEARAKETENRMLRAEAQAQEARRLVLVLALLLAVAVMASLGAIVVRHMRRSRRYANLAMRDDLTGLPNRRSILEYAGLQFRGRRGADDKGFVLALLDIDHFKSINDKLGHSVGDAVLQAFAQAAQVAMRAGDRLGRFGGEEFVLVMPASDIATAPSVFERLREAIATLTAPGLPEGWRLAFSMGATEARPQDPDLDSIIKRADEALYRAKNLGRDRLEVA